MASCNLRGTCHKLYHVHSDFSVVSPTGHLKNFFDYGCVTQDLLFGTYGISVYMGINRPQCIRLVVLTKLNLILEHLKSKLFNSSGGRAKK